MIFNAGQRLVGSTVYIPWHTFQGADGASITQTGLATSDIKIYKNGSVTQRSSTAGYTLLDTDGTDFDGITGLHYISIDLSDNTDAGFYAAGNHYAVAINSVTIDGATVNFWVGTFDIVAAAATVEEIVDAVLDEDITGHAIPDSVAEAITTGASGADPEAIATQVWDTVSASHLTSGTVGKALADINNTVASGVRLSATGVDDILRTALTESYAADGAQMTVEQALYMIMSVIGEFGIVGTTLTCKRVDGTTQSMVYTLNDATNPTSRTRTA